MAFIQNGAEDGPGIFASALADAGVALDVVHVWRGEPMPGAEDYDGYALGGGEISVYQADTYPFLHAEQALVREARTLRRPLLGMCLGAQIMAAAFGGHVFANAEKEIGFYDVTFAGAAEEDALWNGQTATFQPAQWHGDTFTLPAGAVLLASSAITLNQLFRVDDIHYGFQFHLEMDLPVITSMIADDERVLAERGVDTAAFLRDAQEKLPALEPLARQVFIRWTRLLG